MPRSRTAAGSPRAARSVPGGVSRANAGIPIASPTTISGMPGQALASVRPAIVSPAPSDEDQRERQAPPGVDRDVVLARNRGRGRPIAADRRQGHDRRDRDQRQQPEEHEPPVEDLGDDGGDDRPDAARAGPRPSTSWRTSAARSRSGSARPIATYATAGIAPAPSPWRTRPATRTGIDGASPPTTQADREQAEPEQVRPRQRPAVDHHAGRRRSRRGWRGRTPRTPSRRASGRRPRGPRRRSA